MHTHSSDATHTGTPMSSLSSTQDESAGPADDDAPQLDASSAEVNHLDVGQCIKIAT